jgi:hypothetical protein
MGTVTFRDDNSSTPFGPVTLDAHGTATLTTSSLPRGTNDIDVSYSGDGANYGPSAASNVTTVQVTGPLETDVTFGSPLPYGREEIFNAKVWGTAGNPTPTDSVTFTVDGTALGTRTLDVTGSAMLVWTSPLAVGSHQVTATYSGDSTYPTNTSAAMSLTVTRATPFLDFRTAQETIRAGQPVWLQVTAMPSAPDVGVTPTGTVTFYDGSTALGPPVPLDGTGAASSTFPGLSAGTHSISALYSGDGNYLTNQTVTVYQDVRMGIPTQLLLTASPIRTVPGQHVTLTAHLVPQSNGSSPPPSLEVTFHDGSIVLGTVGIGAGTATLTVVLPAGERTLTADYIGDTWYDPSTSAPVTVTTADATPSRRFVDRAYEDVLARASDAGATAWATALDQNRIDRTQFAMQLSTSTEYITDRIEATYQAHLGRSADPQGLAFWIDYIRRGATFEDLEVSFLGTPEYYQRAGGTPDGFLTALYGDVFGRNVDPFGRMYWDGRLTSGTSSWVVAASVVMSWEAMSNRVADDYLLLLRRQPDQQGLMSWTSMLQHGARDEALIAYLVGSGEYWNESQAY